MSTAIVPLLTFSFHGDDVEVVEWKGQRAWLAPQVERALRLAKAGAVAQTIRDSDEFVDGTHFVRVSKTTGEPIARQTGNGSNAGFRGDEVTLLLESGLYLFLMLSRAPRAAEFRRVLSTEVLPTLSRTGSYSLPGTTSSGLTGLREAIDDLRAIASTVRPEPDLNLRETRLLAAQLSRSGERERARRLLAMIADRALEGQPIPGPIPDRNQPALPLRHASPDLDAESLLDWSARQVSPFRLVDALRGTGQPADKRREVLAARMLKRAGYERDRRRAGPGQRPAVWWRPR